MEPSIGTSSNYFCYVGVNSDKIGSKEEILTSFTKLWYIAFHICDRYILYKRVGQKRRYRRPQVPKDAQKVKAIEGSMAGIQIKFQE